MMNINRLYDDKKEIDRLYRFFIKKNLLIEKNTEGLLKAHINKAKHNLEFFEKNQDDDNFKDWQIVILYYTLYHSALALVANKGYVSENHNATLIFLLKRYDISKDDAVLIQELSISKEDARLYDSLKTQRRHASYDTNYIFDKEKIKYYKKRVIEFIQKTIEITKNA